MTVICGNFPPIFYKTSQAGMVEIFESFFLPPSTDCLRNCQTEENISFYPPLHGIILANYENAKNERKKTGNLLLISCLGVPFCMYGYH